MLSCWELFTKDSFLYSLFSYKILDSFIRCTNNFTRQSLKGYFSVKSGKKTLFVFRREYIFAKKAVKELKYEGVLY